MTHSSTTDTIDIPTVLDELALAVLRARSMADARWRT